MADQLKNGKEFVVRISGTWIYTRTISASSADDAYDLAELEFQGMDMGDLATTVQAFDLNDIKVIT